MKNCDHTIFLVNSGVVTEIDITVASKSLGFPIDTYPVVIFNSPGILVEVRESSVHFESGGP